MSVRLHRVLFLVVAFLALVAPCLWAQDGLQGALLRTNLAAPLDLTAPFQRTLAVADFDNDHKLDGAVLVPSGLTASGQSRYRIELHFSTAANTILTFESTETALTITASDINRDGAEDVIVEQPLTHKRLYVWLGDGQGGFRKGRIEDYPANGGSNDQLDAPKLLSNGPLVYIIPQRGLDAVEYTPQLMAYPPSPSNGIEAVEASSSLTAPALSLLPSRAPPASAI
jgi:hypothetical protein